MNILRTILFVFAILSITLVVGTRANAQDDIRKQIYKLFPQADANKDGVISASEEAAVRRQVVKRYPSSYVPSDSSAAAFSSRQELTSIMSMDGSLRVWCVSLLDRWAASRSSFSPRVQVWIAC